MEETEKNDVIKNENLSEVKITKKALDLESETKTPTQLLREKLFEHNICPEILKEPPNDTVLIIFPSGVKVNYGNLITIYQSRFCPCLFYWPVNFGKLYTIIIVDLDYPSRSNPVDSAFLIYLVSNIYANDIKKGDIIANYYPSQPAKETGQHRILILAYLQESFLRINLKIEKDTDSRIKFSLNDFIEKHGLGSKPIAGNFFICSN